VAKAIAQERCDGACQDQEEQYKEDDSEDFHGSILLRGLPAKQWQK
jgi:hypothetical protein